MTFRDDREAAHQRADALQRELSEARDKLSRLEGQRPSRAPLAAAAIVVAGVVMTLGAGAWLFVGSARDRDARAQVAARQQQLRQLEALRAAQDQQREAEAAAAEQREAARLAEINARAAAQAEVPVERVTWRGVVEASTDGDVAAGSACTVEGGFSRGAMPTIVRSLVVRCGARVIYTAPPGEARANAPGVSAVLREGPVHGAATHRYLLQFTDAAAGAADRAKLAVVSVHHSAVVTREGSVPTRVSIFLRDASDPREGPPLVGHQRAVREPAFAADVERSLRVLSVRGQAPAARGARCEFSVRAVWEYPETCRVALRCGTTWLYGARTSGYLTCEVRDGAAVGALDTNPTSQGGDPRLEWTGSRVTVGDFSESGAWEVVLGPSSAR
jgi:hypothetical protein